MYDLQGRVAIVTGAAGGIGRGIASRVVTEGVSVALVDRDATAWRQAASALREREGRVHAVVADVSIRTDVERAVASTTDELGPIDILVNNAGVWTIKPYT